MNHYPTDGGQRAETPPADAHDHRDWRFSPPCQQNTKQMPASTDVFVIGGGPAGLAAAIAASSRGFSVTIADGALPPIDKACGEGLMPDGLAALRELGVEITARDGFAFRGVRFVDEGAVAETRFPGVAQAEGAQAGRAMLVRPGIGVRRPVLQQRMMERAAALGATFLWGTPVSGLCRAGVALAGGAMVRARWIIGADGSGSRVRRWSGLDAHVHKSSRFAFRRHYRVTPWSDCAQVYWGEHAQAYVTPVSREEICVVIVTRGSGQRMDALLEEFPGLVASLSHAAATSAERGAVTLMHGLRCVTRGNVALIGDASGSVDAITGEGLCLSFHQAAALAKALERGDLTLYQRAHRRLARRPTFMARMMLALDARPTLRRRVLRAFSANPAIFARMLAVHVGATSPAHLAMTGAMLGWRFLAADGELA
jgi:flavin-dependent dehydrogenase